MPKRLSRQATWIRPWYYGRRWPFRATSRPRACDALGKHRQRLQTKRPDWRQHDEEALVYRAIGAQWCTASKLGNWQHLPAMGNLTNAQLDTKPGTSPSNGSQIEAVDSAKSGHPWRRSEHEQAVEVAEALTVLLAIGVADGPGADLRLAGCGKTAASATNFQASGTGRSLHRRHSRPIDQMRMRRPEPTMNLPVCVETAE